MGDMPSRYRDLVLLKFTTLKTTLCTTYIYTSHKVGFIACEDKVLGNHSSDKHISLPGASAETLQQRVLGFFVGSLKVPSARGT